MGTSSLKAHALKVLGHLDPSFLRRLSWTMQAAFGGARNYYNVFGYTPNPNFDQRYIKYLRQDVAGRVVDAPAAALWSNPPQIISSSADWDAAWSDLEERYQLWSSLDKCDKLAGIGRYSILLIGYNDGAPLDQPVNTRSVKQRTDQKILYLQPYSERCVDIVSYNQNPRDEDFNRPEMYRVTPMSEYVLSFNGLGRNSKDNVPGTFNVHASRVIHIAENCLENNVFGSPRLERVYNTLDDLMKITGGSAETYWLTANRGIHIDIDKDMELAPDDEAALSDEVTEYQSQINRFLRTRGAKVQSLGSDTPDPTGPFKMLISIISGATGIPQRVLIGSEAGQLASEQDRANWADRIDERRALWGNPHVLFPLMKRLTTSGYLPSDPTLSITVEWPHAFKMSPLENAQTSAQHARSATNFAKTFETMENLKRGDPGSQDTTAPDGTVIPGKPAIPGVNLGDLITIDEARRYLGLDKPPVTFDSGEDIGGVPAPSNNNPKKLPPVAQFRADKRRVTLSQHQLMRF